MADTIDKIQDDAEGPVEGQDDAGRFKDHPLRDRLEVLKHAERNTAAARGGLPMRLGKIRPPGAV